MTVLRLRPERQQAKRRTTDLRHRRPEGGGRNGAQQTRAFGARRENGETDNRFALSAPKKAAREEMDNSFAPSALGKITDEEMDKKLAPSTLGKGGTEVIHNSYILTPTPHTQIRIQRHTQHTYNTHIQHTCNTHAHHT